MAYNNDPIFLAGVEEQSCATSGASTSPDASTTTNLVKLVAASTNGVRVERVNGWHAPASQTTAQTAAIGRCYIKQGATTFILVQEKAVAAATRSASVPGNGIEFSRTDGQPLCFLKAADELWVSVSVGEPYHWYYTGGPM